MVRYQTEIVSGTVVECQRGRRRALENTNQPLCLMAGYIPHVGMSDFCLPGLHALSFMLCCSQFTVHTPRFTVHAPPTKKLPSGSFLVGGEGGIRTHGRLAPSPHFECGPFDHSGTSPKQVTGNREQGTGNRQPAGSGGPAAAPRLILPICFLLSGTRCLPETGNREQGTDNPPVPAAYFIR